MDYNPYAAPAAEARVAEPPRAGPGPWTMAVQSLLIVPLLALHGLLLLGGLVELFEGEGILSLRNFGDARTEDKVGEAAGEIWVFVLAVIWGPVSIGWGFANIVGLLSKARWYYRSLFAYWIINLLTCLCAPFGLVGLIHLVLSRPRADGSNSW